MDLPEDLVEAHPLPRNLTTRWQPNAPWGGRRLSSSHPHQWSRQPKEAWPDGWRPSIGDHYWRIPYDAIIYKFSYCRKITFLEESFFANGGYKKGSCFLFHLPSVLVVCGRWSFPLPPAFRIRTTTAWGRSERDNKGDNEAVIYFFRQIRELILLNQRITISISNLPKPHLKLTDPAHHQRGSQDHSWPFLHTNEYPHFSQKKSTLISFPTNKKKLEKN
jgi:hypothetical protein